MLLLTVEKESGVYGVPYPRLQVIGSCPHTTYLYLLRYLNRRTGRADLCPWKVGQRAPTASFVNGSRPGLPGASRGEAAGFLHVLQGSSAGCVPPAGLDLAVFGVFSAAPVSVELSPPPDSSETEDGSHPRALLPWDSPKSGFAHQLAAVTCLLPVQVCRSADDMSPFPRGGVDGRTPHCLRPCHNAAMLCCSSQRRS